MVKVFILTVLPTSRGAICYSCNSAETVCGTTVRRLSTFFKFIRSDAYKYKQISFDTPDKSHLKEYKGGTHMWGPMRVRRLGSLKTCLKEKNPITRTQIAIGHIFDVQ